MTKTTSSTSPHIGSTLDEFLETEGVRGEFEALAVKEVTAWQNETPRATSVERLQQDIQAGLDSGPAGELDIEAIKRRGRERLNTARQERHGRALLTSGETGHAVAQSLGVSRATLYRALGPTS